MRRQLAAMLALVAIPAAATRADDFGRRLEQAAKGAILKGLAPPESGARPRPDRGAGPGAGRPLGPVPEAGARSEPVPVKTADGWTLVAHHYRPAGPPRPGALPVILCHGLTYNASFWDLDPRCSFAEYLARLGYDVWAVDLRGSGMSQKWVWKLDEAPELVVGSAIRRLSRGKLAPTGYATIDPKAANWTLDHHIAYDVPAFVKLVRQQTGAPAVTWVGHSMGGIVAIGHLARFQNPGIGRLVTVGSQVTMPQTQLAAQFIRELIEVRGQQLAGQLRGKELMVQSRTSMQNMFFNQRNVAGEVYEALGGPATDVPALGLMQQYSALSMGGELLDAKKQFNYAKALGNIKVPMFIACGADDQFAPPSVQQYLYQNVGSTEKALVVFGRAQGFSVDCGHDDALVGLNSRAEVYPVIEKFLRGPGN